MNPDESIAEPEAIEAVPVENPETELARLVSEGDPDLMLAILEKKAALAPRFRQARDVILASHTHVNDWMDFDGKMCLSSAGAERVATLFDIRFFDCRHEKRPFQDAEGQGYLYVYTGNAQCGNRVVFAQGVYSTRDRFLGRKDGQWRSLEEINERDVMQAAYHIFKGNAVKELLGLRNIPREEWQRIMQVSGRDGSKAGSVQHGRGTQGGTTHNDQDKQRELAQICLAIAQAACFPQRQDNGSFSLVPVPDQFTGLDDTALGKEVCITLSTFGSNGKTIQGKGAKQLKGKWLGTTLRHARALHEALEKEEMR